MFPRSFIAVAFASVVSAMCAAIFYLPLRPTPVAAQTSTQARISVRLPDGSKAVTGDSGFGAQFDARGNFVRPIPMIRSVGVTDALNRVESRDRVAAEYALRRSRRPLATADEVIVVFRDTVNASGAASALTSHRRVEASDIGDQPLASAFGTLRVRAVRPLFATLSSGRLRALDASAQARSSRNPIELSRAYVLTIGAETPQSAAQRLRALASVAYASPNYFVDSMSSGPRSYPIDPRARNSRFNSSTSSEIGTPSVIPDNYGVASSEQSYLNTPSTNAIGVWPILARFGQMPGEGEIITNVSVGDLTDQSMADAGDGYVQLNGPTTVLVGGQRYIDVPALPLIPTYTANQSGILDGRGSTEVGDPGLGEALLDFSMMAPLPHNRQRPGRQGKDATDLLGIAPGARYRLVVPERPTSANIAAALIGAAAQLPKPDVITASLGYGTDGVGFPGRFLEDDPLTHAVVTSIVQSYGIVVVISSNDGTRRYTNEAVNPDGGSTPTDLAQGTPPTNIADDVTSTTPTVVGDSGAIVAGGSTLDDVSHASSRYGRLSTENAFAETRINGSMSFSSGFGSRVSLSAPSDNVPALYHVCRSYPCLAQDVIPVLQGGTSASAPQIAAAAAIILQAGRLSNRSLTPADVRATLAQSGRALPKAPEIGRDLNVGSQLDVTAALLRVLGSKAMPRNPTISRIAIAQRQSINALGGTFVEETDSANISLDGPVSPGDGTRTGQDAISPITIAPDWTDVPTEARYELTIGSRIVARSRWCRLVPRVLLEAAGLPLVSSTSRTIRLTYRALLGNRVLVSRTFPMTFGATDGTYAEALAPDAPPVADEGSTVRVSYDLSNVRNVTSPKLYVSSIGHWSFVNAPYWRPAYEVALSGRKGTIDLPASAFVGGAGIYGIGTIQSIDTGGLLIGGEVSAIRIRAAKTGRPPAPNLRVDSGPGSPGGHSAVVTRANPVFHVDYDVSGVPGATNAVLEVSAAGPTVQSVYNVFTNAFGDARDANGVDTPSTVYQALPGRTGTARLDATALGLASSMFYTLRVLPGVGTRSVGEASPVSSLQYDDGVAPNGSLLTSFALRSAGKSTVTTAIEDSNGSVREAAAVRFDQKTGGYGATLVDDPTGSSLFYLFGEDAARTPIVRTPNDVGAPPSILTFDDSNDLLVSQVSLPKTAYISGGFTDRVRHRLTFLTNATTSPFSATISRFDLATQTFASDIAVGKGLSFPNMFAVDASKDVAYVSSRNVECSPSSSGIEPVNLATGAVGTTLNLPTCEEGIAADEVGGRLFLPHGGLYNFAGPPFPSQTVTVREAPLSQLSVQQEAARAGYFPVYDALHKLLLIGYIAPGDYRINNTTTGVVGVYDGNDGRLLKTIRGVNFVYGFASRGPYLDGGLQLDVATRTAWTYGPAGNQLQRFSY